MTTKLMYNTLAGLAMLATTACIEQPVNHPFRPPVPLCQTNNTASIYFENKSPTMTQDVVWDGVRIDTLAPGEKSEPLTVSAGITHHLAFKRSNSGWLSCQVARPILSQCDDTMIFCTAQLETR